MHVLQKVVGSFGLVTRWWNTSVFAAIANSAFSPDLWVIGALFCLDYWVTPLWLIFCFQERVRNCCEGKHLIVDNGIAWSGVALFVFSLPYLLLQGLVRHGCSFWVVFFFFLIWANCFCESQSEKVLCVWVVIIHWNSWRSFGHDTPPQPPPFSSLLEWGVVHCAFAQIIRNWWILAVGSLLAITLVLTTTEPEANWGGGYSMVCW